MTTKNPTHRLLELLKELSFKKGDFTLASGKKSDWFIDCKQTVLTAEGHVLVADAFLEKIQSMKVKPTAIAAVALGGCSIASAVSMRSFQIKTPLDAIYVRKQAKDHGTSRVLEGNSHIPPKTKIVILEDTVTTGGSTLWAVGQLEKASFEVLGVLAIVDRNEGGKENIEAKNLFFDSLFHRKDFMES